MAINPLIPSDMTSGMSRKSNKNHDNKPSITDHSESHNVTELADETPAAEEWKFLQSTDEMSAVVTQFYNRKLYDKKMEELSFSYEYILEESAEVKTEKILQAAQSKDVNLNVLVTYVHKLFPDDSDLIVVLRGLTRRNKIDKIVKENLQRALDYIENTIVQKFVKSGINCALKAKLFGKILSLSPKLLRTCYRNFLLSENSAIDTYIDLISNFGYQKRACVLDFIEDSLLCDINAHDASCSASEFGFFLKKMCQLQLLQASERQFLQYTVSNAKAHKLDDSEDVWLYFLLLVLKKPDSISINLEEIKTKVLKSNTDQEVTELLMIIYWGFRKLPTLLFSEESSLPETLEFISNEINKYAAFHKFNSY